ncbi:MAG: hypothetical protein HWE10_00765 [Gammaproteobacteria bacterium]|nr:hypothetical protein [Gammaproteobacteria bacterium]
MITVLCGATWIASAQQMTSETSLNSTNDMGMDHSHIPIALPESANRMALSLSLREDSMSGYNLILDTKHYHWSIPPSGMDMMAMMSASIDEATNNVEGHAHLYVNGEKIQRVYGKYLHLPEALFRDGLNSISVTLNNHGHMYWTIDDKKVLATLFINRGGSPLITHKFESFPANLD